MGKIILDQTTRAKLGNLREHLELCDESGQVLGYFTPAHDPSLYAGMASEEELDRREHAGGGGHCPKSWPIWNGRHEVFRNLGSQGRRTGRY